MLLLICMASLLADVLTSIVWWWLPPPPFPPRAGPPSPVAAPLPSRSTWSWSQGGTREAHDRVMAGLRAVWIALSGIVVLIALHPFVALLICLVYSYIQRRVVGLQQPHASVLSTTAAGMMPLILTYTPAMIGWVHSGLSYSGGVWLDVPLVFAFPLTAHAVMVVGEQLTDVSLKTIAVNPVRETMQRIARVSAACGTWQVGGWTVLSLLQAVLAGVALAVGGGMLWPLYVGVLLLCACAWVQGMADGLQAKARLVASLAAHLD